MAAPWSHAQTILEPPYCRLKVTIDGELRDKLQNVKSSLSHLLKSQQLHEMLIAESRLLHISIYKRSAQLRIEKSKQLLKRVKACLQRLHVVGRLFTLVENVNMDISRPLSIQKDETFLPSQQVWTYVLFLASNYFQLLTKTIEYCVTAFDCHFTSGMLIPTMVLNMGIVARIWQLCRGLQTRIAPFYAVVYSVHCEMKPSMSDWTYPSIPPELSNPVMQMVSHLEDEEWSSTLTLMPGTTFDSASGEQSASAQGLSDEADRSTVTAVPPRLLINESEDLGEIVVSKKRKSERPNDKAFVASKKRKIQPQKSAKTLLQERPTNKTDEPNHEDMKTIHKKKKKTKEKKGAREENVSMPKQTFDTSAIGNKTDGLKKILKKKLKKKNKIKASTLKKMSDGNISNDEVKNKLKKDAKQRSKLKKKQLNNNNNNDLNLNVGKQKLHKTDCEEQRKVKMTKTTKSFHNVEKKKKKGKNKVAASDFHSSHKKGKIKRKKK